MKRVLPAEGQEVEHRVQDRHNHSDAQQPGAGLLQHALELLRVGLRGAAPALLLLPRTLHLHLKLPLKHRDGAERQLQRQLGHGLVDENELV